MLHQFLFLLVLITKSCTLRTLICVCVQVLGSLVTLVGSGVGYVVSSALETLGFLASNYAQELIPFSPHISGTINSFLIHVQLS